MRYKILKHTEVYLLFHILGVLKMRQKGRQVVVGWGEGGWQLFLDTLQIKKLQL